MADIKITDLPNQESQLSFLERSDTLITAIDRALDARKISGGAASDHPSLPTGYVGNHTSQSGPIISQ